MKRKFLKIGKPEIVEKGSQSALQAVIYEGERSKVLEYCVDKKYEKYLTWERSDAFVVALLYYAMIKNIDIEWETPCNAQLIYQLKTYFIPVYAHEFSFIHRIELRGDVSYDVLSCENGVAAGFSNGVDSGYTIYKYRNSTFPEYRLTHLFFTDCFSTDFSEEYQKDFIASYLKAST